MKTRIALAVLLLACAEKKPAEKVAERPPETVPAEAAKTPPGFPRDLPPPPPMPKDAPPPPEYHVPRLLFFVPATAGLSAKDGAGTRYDAIASAINTKVPRWMDYYDVGLVQAGHAADDCATVKTTTAAGYKVKEPIMLALGLGRPVGGKLALPAMFEALGAKELTVKSPTQVVVITSGGESCGDACAAVDALKAKSKDLVVHLVAYQTDPAKLGPIDCLAKRTGGRILAAKDEHDLAAQLEKALGKQLCPPMAMPCWEAAFENPLPEVRQMVVDHCCSLSSPVAFRCPYKALRDPERSIRERALSCLLEKNWSRTDEALLLALHDADASVRAKVMDHLEKNPPDQRLKPALTKAVQDPDVGIKKRALAILGKTISGWTIAPIAEAFADPSPAVRVAAVNSVAQRFDDGAFEVLKLGAKDGAPEVREAALGLLAAAKDPRAIPALELLAKDKKLGKRAAEALAAAPK